LDGRNIPTDIFGNSYIRLEHLGESISVGFYILGNPEQDVTWWQEGSLHDLRGVLRSSLVEFLSFCWGLVCGRGIAFARAVEDGGISVSHWQKVIR